MTTPFDPETRRDASIAKLAPGQHEYGYYAQYDAAKPSGYAPPTSESNAQSTAYSSASEKQKYASMLPIPANVDEATARAVLELVAAQRGQAGPSHEQDAGALPIPGEKLPPTYNPGWLDARTQSESSQASPSVSDVNSSSEHALLGPDAAGAPFRPPMEKPGRGPL